MPKLPPLTARQIIRALKKAGFVEDRQRGSHLVLFHSGSGARTVVPIHRGKTIKKKLAHSILKDAELTVEEFLDLL
ncbi:MAG: type II toxin-antitoxin system HicA family toxin [Patescibacteria group bacterium]